MAALRCVLYYVGRPFEEVCVHTSGARQSVSVSVCVCGHVGIDTAPVSDRETAARTGAMRCARAEKRTARKIGWGSVGPAIIIREVRLALEPN